MNMDKQKLTAITFLLVLIFIGLMFAFNEESNTTTANSKNEQSSVDLSSIKSNVVSTSDSIFGPIKRITLNVVVSGDLTKEKLFELGKVLASNYIKTNKVNALSVGFYNNASEIGKGYTHGNVDYVPNGKWEDAINVKAGDYKTFKFVDHIKINQLS